MIRTTHLRKEYKNVVAVNDLNMEIEEGDVYGFIGPNGAGKTTTIKVLATLIAPSYGTAYIDGLDVRDYPRAVRAKIGYMPDFFGVYDDMKVWEYLDFFAAAYKIPREKRIQIINDVLELTDLQVKREDFVEALSRGMKQRLCLAKTLVHDPEVLLLDEPASGLDPRARVEMRELLKELRRMGKTILISSHILSELADFCNKIGIIEKGQLLLSGDVREIREKIRAERAVLITLRQRAEEAELLLLTVPGVAGVTREDSTMRVAVTADLPDAGELVRILVEHGFVVTACHEESADLEDIFMRITKGLVA
ncbi:MAG TPA: ABC transporter ATP-binding protein [Firmicutes bacterium]|nr:ABC transporter ATP-binding protein [Bacillota bacterium]